MFGEIGDEKLKGIVPRAAKAIFNYITKNEYDIEYTVKCSMLEIYR